jgi:hypothetical protein
MPPKSEPRPDPKQSFAAVEWVGRELKRAEREARIAGGRNLLRRLNRDEYANTVVDLLGLDPRLSDKLREELPADGQSEGFDRVAAALFFDETQLERYLGVAELVAREAVQTAPPRSEKYLWQANRHIGESIRQKVNENLDHIIETGPPTHFKTEKGMIIRSAIHYGGKGPEFIAKHQRKIDAGLDAMERDMGASGFCMGSSFTLADVGCASALLYLDLSQPDLKWRDTHPKLAKAFAQWKERPSLKALG